MRADGSGQSISARPLPSLAVRPSRSMTGLRSTRPGWDRLCSPMLASRAPTSITKSPCVRDRPLVGQGTVDGAKADTFSPFAFSFPG